MNDFKRRLMACVAQLLLDARKAERDGQGSGLPEPLSGIERHDDFLQSEADGDSVLEEVQRRLAELDDSFGEPAHIEVRALGRGLKRSAEKPCSRSSRFNTLRAILRMRLPVHRC